MKKHIITYGLILGFITTVTAQIPNGFGKSGTMFRDDQTNLKYILVDPANLPSNAIVNKAILKRSLFTQPQTDLKIEIYNVFFNHKDLAVFSVMPSLFSNMPTWKKINIDTIKSKVITASNLYQLMQAKFAAYPQKFMGCWIG